jgi:hypothetical protein
VSQDPPRNLEDTLPLGITITGERERAQAEALDTLLRHMSMGPAAPRYVETVRGADGARYYTPPTEAQQRADQMVSAAQPVSPPQPGLVGERAVWTPPDTSSIQGSLDALQAQLTQEAETARAAAVSAAEERQNRFRSGLQEARDRQIREASLEQERLQNAALEARVARQARAEAIERERTAERLARVEAAERTHARTNVTQTPGVRNSRMPDLPTSTLRNAAAALRSSIQTMRAALAVNEELLDRVEQELSNTPSEEPAPSGFDDTPYRYGERRLNMGEEQ